MQIKKVLMLCLILIVLSVPVYADYSAELQEENRSWIMVKHWTTTGQGTIAVLGEHMVLKDSFI